MGRGQSEVIKALLLLGVMVAVMISYIGMTSNFTSSYEEELVTRSFRNLAEYIIQTVHQNSAALGGSPAASENVEYVVVNLDLPKQVGNHYYTVKASGDKLTIYANDDHDLRVEYPQEGIKGFSITGQIASISENFYMSIGNKEKKASLFSSKILYSGEVSPGIGGTETLFRYTVIFQNSKNEAPDNVYVYINDNAENEQDMVQHSMSKVTQSMYSEDLRDGDFTNGELYYYDVTLSEIREYRYYFECEYDNKTDTFPVGEISGPEIPVNISLRSDKEVIEAGTETATLNLKITDKDGNAISGLDVKFTATFGRFSNGDNEHTVSTDTNGEATDEFKSNVTGIAQIEAEVQGEKESVEIIVHGEMDYIVIEFYDGTPVGDISLRVGERTTFYARGYDASGLLVGDVEANWSSSGTLEEISEQGTSLEFIPTTEGEGKIYATYTVDPSIEDSTGTINVYGSIYEIRIVDDTASDESVGNISMTTADTLTLYAKGYDAEGNFVSFVKVDWNRSSGNLDDLNSPTTSTTSVTFEPHTAHTSGVIQATKGSYQKFTGTITVSHDPDVNAIEIYDNSGRVSSPWTPEKNTEHELYAKGVSTSNSDDPIEDVYVTWSVTGDIGTVDPSEGAQTTYSTGDNADNTGTIEIDCGCYTDSVNVEVQSSCPFIYSYYNNSWHYEHESYPFAIAQSLEYTSYEVIDHPATHFRLSEERDEVSYTDQIYLMEVEEHVYPDIHGDLHRINERILPTAAYSEEENVLNTLQKKDSKYWIQGSNPDFSDSLIMEFDNVKKGEAKLFLTIREAERGVYLLRSTHEHMGINNMGTFYRFVEDIPLTRSLFVQTVRREFFIHVDVWNGKKWVRQGEFGVGRESFIDTVIPVELYSSNAKIRLSTGSGAYEIDYACIDTTKDGNIDYRIVKPIAAKKDGKNVLPLISRSDDTYLQMFRGDLVDLRFDIEKDRNYIVAVEGYYHPFFGETYVSKTEFMKRFVDFLRGITERGFVGELFEGEE